MSVRRQRVAGPDSFTLKEGPITAKAVLRFRSFAAAPKLFLGINLIICGRYARGDRLNGKKYLPVQYDNRPDISGAGLQLLPPARTAGFECAGYGICERQAPVKVTYDRPPR